MPIAPLLAVVRHHVPVRVRARAGARDKFLLDPVDTPTAILGVAPDAFEARSIRLSAHRSLDALVHAGALWRPLVDLDAERERFEPGIEGGLAALARGPRHTVWPADFLEPDLPVALVDHDHDGSRAVPPALSARAVEDLRAPAVARVGGAGGRDLVHDGRRILARIDVPLVDARATHGLLRRPGSDEWSRAYRHDRVADAETVEVSAGFGRRSWDREEADRAAFLGPFAEGLRGVEPDDGDVLAFAHLGAATALAGLRACRVRNPVLDDALCASIARTAIRIHDDLPAACATVAAAAEAIITSGPQSSLAAKKAVLVAGEMLAYWRLAGEPRVSDAPDLGGFAP